MVALHERVPDFRLPDSSGNLHSRDALVGEFGLVVVFACNHCPFVKHVSKQLGALADEYQAKGFGFVAINANDPVKFPDDHPELMAGFAAESGWAFPYLFDESQDVARQFGAQCTPDFFVSDVGHRLIYRGEMDPSRPSNDHPVDGSSIRDALDNCAAGRAPIADQPPSVGCSIKWRDQKE